LTRVQEANFQSLYRKTAALLQVDLNIRHAWEGKEGTPGRTARHNVELIYTTFDAEGVPTSNSFYIVMRAPASQGPVPVVNSAVGLMNLLLASTNAMTTSVASWDS